MHLLERRRATHGQKLEKRFTGVKFTVIVEIYCCRASFHTGASTRNTPKHHAELGRAAVAAAQLHTPFDLLFPSSPGLNHPKPLSQRKQGIQIINFQHIGLTMILSNIRYKARCSSNDQVCFVTRRQDVLLMIACRHGSCGDALAADRMRSLRCS